MGLLLFQFAQACHGRGRRWPTGIKRQMGDRLGELFNAHAIAFGQLQMKRHLLHAVERHQRRHGDQTALARREPRSLPYIVE
ncbi:hypothetical protein D3C76_1268790 [compost metagenome]